VIMGWNHRVLATSKDNEIYLQIHEVYYNSEGVPDGYTMNPITIGSEEISSLRWTINKISDSLKKPILWAGDKFPQECKITYECLLCGRNKFTKKSPHQCNHGFRKRNIEWKINYS